MPTYIYFLPSFPFGDIAAYYVDDSSPLHGLGPLDIEYQGIILPLQVNHYDIYHMLELRYGLELGGVLESLVPIFDIWPGRSGKLGCW